ncbi:methyltransferase [Salinispirillum sp. LH 10-3-1]|uniref:Methyltransferase n=1 Tax=Salinispirillum sp. LH 10-3-1 TaxID=2952525 RepID=A0AB38YE65_9GAMM
MPEISAPDTQFHCATGTFTLHRLPERHHPALRAWDAADDYLIQTLHATPKAPLLLVNDAFGALGVALHARQPTLWYDSAVEADALEGNLRRNNLPDLVRVPQTELPPNSAAQVVLKLPRSSALLDWQLAQLNQHLPVGTPILLAGMLKHVTPADQKVMQARLGNLQASRIVRKARYWQAETTDATDLPTTQPLVIDDFQLTLHNHPGVFSPRRLDPGAACLLQHLTLLDIADLPAQPRVIDLCCGNGVLGLAWLRLHPETQMTFCDASAAAISSVQASAQHNLGAEHQWFVVLRDGLQHADPESADLILCNPPFHQSDTVTTDVAQALFHQARGVLTATGSMVVVANRHLGYHQLMKSYFRSVTTLSSDKRFVVLLAKEPRPLKGNAY